MGIKMNSDIGVGAIIAAAIAILTLLMPTAFWLLWSVSGFATSIGATEYTWGQFVVGTWIVYLVKVLLFAGVKNG